uniref:Coiled-coil domain containing 88B n=1 Tax=Myotis lucifugus TaxID=59463 RepID=G1QFT5_MYOLU
QVTRHQESLLDLQWLEVPDMALEEVEYLSSSMTCRLRRVLIEQDHCRKLFVTMTQEWNTSSRPSEDTQHLAMELADTKATLRGVRQELEEKTKQLADTRNQLYQLVLELQAARHNNMELAARAQASCAPVPELDSLREKASRVERLEMEAMGLRQKQKDIVEFYASRMKELIEDNFTLMDTKGLLQEQLTVAWSRVDKLYELEEENAQLKSKLRRLHLIQAQDTDQKHLEELQEENLALKAAQEQSVEESAQLRWELDQLSEEAKVADGAAHEPFQLEAHEQTSSCFLKLDQEKQSLQGTIQGMQDAFLALQESSLQRQELEEENQQLSKQIEDLRVQMEREKQTNQDLEILSEELMEEREQLLCDIETLKAERAQEIKDLEQVVLSLRESSQASSEACLQDIENENKVLHQTVMETSSRVSKLEWERQQLHRAQELEQELHRLQEENEKLAMEVSALTTAPERVHALERESQDLLLENQRLQTSLDTLQPEGLERDMQLEFSMSLLNFHVLFKVVREGTQGGYPEKGHKLLKVENSTLSPQSASLTALIEKNTQLQHQQLAAAHEALQREHACLGALHEHLSGEHEALMDEYSRQKTLLRRTLELESKVLSDSDVELVRLETEGQEGPPGEKGVPTNPSSEWPREVQRDSQPGGSEMYRELQGGGGEGERCDKEQVRCRDLASQAPPMAKGHRKERLSSHSGPSRCLSLSTHRSWLQAEVTSTADMGLGEEGREGGLERHLPAWGRLKGDDSVSTLDLGGPPESALNREVSCRRRNSLMLMGNKILECCCVCFSKISALYRQDRGTGEDLETCLKPGALKPKPADVPTPHIGKDFYRPQPLALCLSTPRANSLHQQLKREQEELQTHTKKLQTSLSDTQLQVNCWQAQCNWLRKEQEELQIYNNELQTSLNEMQLEKNRWQARYKGLKGQQEELQMHSKKLQTSLNDTQLEAGPVQLAEGGAPEQGHLADRAGQPLPGEARAGGPRTLSGLFPGLTPCLSDTQLLIGISAQNQCDWLRKEQEELQIYNNELQTSLNEMQLEKNRWQARYKGLKGQQEELQVHSKKLQTSLKDTQLEVNCWQDQCNWLREELQSRDISLTELDNHCQLLSQLKGNLEGENRHLQSQNQRLKEQNQRLLQEDVENKDQHQEQQWQYVDKLNALQRQNEKLEEKSIAQRKFHDPAPKKKKHWIGAKFLLKLIKLKKGGSRERRKSTSERPSWPLGSSDQASPSTSQPLQSQLEPLDRPTIGHFCREIRGAFNISSSAPGPGDPIPKGVAPPRSSLDCTDASADPATKPRPSELGSRACSSSAITTAPSSSTSTSWLPGHTHGAHTLDGTLQSSSRHLISGRHSQQGSRVTSCQSRRHASRDGSPHGLKGKPGRLHRKPKSSEDLMPSRDTALCLTSRCQLPRTHYPQPPGVLATQNGPLHQEASRRGVWSSPRPGAALFPPEQRMVTLEEFLEE